LEEVSYKEHICTDSAGRVSEWRSYHMGNLDVEGASIYSLSAIPTWEKKIKEFKTFLNVSLLTLMRKISYLHCFVRVKPSQ
jgi:hypothetical protein